MNDTMSLFLATGILAIGGLGLYLYKNNSDDQKDVEYNEDSWFGDGSFFGGSNDEEELHDEVVDDFDEKEEKEYKNDEFLEKKTKTKTKGGKTKRTKTSSGTKRRY
jgi:hypothetical protein